MVKPAVRWCSHYHVAMPELSAKILATKELRKIGFTGTISTTVVFEEEIKQLQAAGTDFIYNYYDGVGASFAQNSLAQANNDKK